MVNGSQIYDNSISLSKLLCDRDLSMNNFKITDLLLPSNDGDAVSKIYVDQKSYSDTNKIPVKVATTSQSELQNVSNSPYVYSNVTDNWTNVVNPKTIDGVSILDGDRILVKNAADAKGNGVWIYSSASQSLVRADDCANDVITDAVRLGITCFVTSGTTNKGGGFILTSNGGSPAAANGIYVLGTDTLTFNQFNGVGTLIAGTAISKVGNTINALFDDSTIGVSANALYVKNSGIGSTHIANSAVINTKIANTAVTYGKLNSDVVNTAGAISLNGGLGNGLAINVDGTTISIIGNALVVANSHLHNNLSTLELFTENAGILSWNGIALETDVQNVVTIDDAATTVIPVCNITEIRAVHITYTLERNGFFATGNIKMLHDGTNPGLETEYITLPTNSNLGVNFDASIASNELRLNVVADATGFAGIFKYKTTTITL